MIHEIIRDTTVPAFPSAYHDAKLMFKVIYALKLIVLLSVPYPTLVQKEATGENDRCHCLCLPEIMVYFSLPVQCCKY